MKATAYLFLLFILLAGCDNFSSRPEKLDVKSDFKTVKRENFSVHVPNYMKEGKDLHKGASVQYLNAFKEVYAIVIVENKEQFISTYSQLGVYSDSSSKLDNYSRLMTESIKYKIGLEPELYESMKIDGRNASIFKMQGEVEGYPTEIAYMLAYIECENKIYSLTLWTLKDRMNKYENTFMQIIKSFKETNG